MNRLNIVSKNAREILFCDNTPVDIPPCPVPALYFQFLQRPWRLQILCIFHRSCLLKSLKSFRYCQNKVGCHHHWDLCSSFCWVGEHLDDGSHIPRRSL